MDAQDNFILMVKIFIHNVFNTAYKILKMIQRQFDVIINESEIVYLAIHIHHFEAQIKIE